MSFMTKVQQHTDKGIVIREVNKKRSYTNAEIAYQFMVATSVFQSVDQLQALREQQEQFMPLNSTHLKKIKKAQEYTPMDFAQMNHENLPFTHAHKRDKNAIERNSLSLTNKFVHEGEFSEEQNIIMGVNN